MSFPYTSIYDLPEIDFIAGTQQTLSFAIFDSSGSPMSLLGSTCTYVLAPYGQSSAVVTKTATAGSATNIMSVTLASGDTATLSGKFIQQPVITTIDSIEYRPSIGIVQIIPRIS
jgi:hypothetical protein